MQILGQVVSRTIPKFDLLYLLREAYDLDIERLRLGASWQRSLRSAQLRLVVRALRDGRSMSVENPACKSDH